MTVLFHFDTQDSSEYLISRWGSQEQQKIRLAPSKLYSCYYLFLVPDYQHLTAAFPTSDTRCTETALFRKQFNDFVKPVPEFVVFSRLSYITAYGL